MAIISSRYLLDDMNTYRVKHENLQGIVEAETKDLQYPPSNNPSETDYFQDIGIRKAILLIKYTDFIKGNSPVSSPS